MAEVHKYIFFYMLIPYQYYRRVYWSLYQYYFWSTTFKYGSFVYLWDSHGFLKI